jgi:hypothetical protein
MEYLSREVRRLQPQKIFCIGTSAGGYAAIRAGHDLVADYVHAFAPQTVGVSPLTGVKKHFLDLAQILEDSNQKTAYYIHYGRKHLQDAAYARHLFHSPGVTTVGYPTDTHLIAVFLAKKMFLTKALALENQERLAEISRAHFAEPLEINGSLEARSDVAAS